MFGFRGCRLRSTILERYKRRARAIVLDSPSHKAQRDLAFAMVRRPKRKIGMVTRTSRKTATFAHPFRLKCLDRTLPAGEYNVVTDEELVEGLSFPVYRRVATLMMVPQDNRGGSAAVEMIGISPDDLAKALVLDRALSAHDLKEDKRIDGNR